MKSVLMAPACLLMLVAHVSLAQETRAAPRDLVGGHGENVMAFIAQHDLDDDGRITWQEFERFREARFIETDENGDRLIDIEEYVQEFDDRYRISLENAREAHLQQTRQRFGALDRDGDGAVSRAEFDASSERIWGRHQQQGAETGKKEQAAPPQPRRRDLLSMPTTHTPQGFLALFDTDGDGKVSRAEFDAVRAAHFSAADEDGDGRLSLDEYLAEYEDRLDRRMATLLDGSDRQTRVRFGALDVNKDGRVSWVEYQASGKRLFNRADRNDDGVVDAADAALPPPPRPQAATRRPAP